VLLRARAVLAPSEAWTLSRRQGVRQREYVQNGCNLTGDAFSQDEEGCFHFVARNDDMIISVGYNIAGHWASR
jgi:acyl-coenzyme A synthetase/AMP-(fatty) acid ligase